jgi:hypothetical protein
MAKQSLGTVSKVYSSGISETTKGIKISKVFNFGEEIMYDDSTKEYSIKEGTKSTGTKKALEERIKELLEQVDGLEKTIETLKDENLELVKQLNDKELVDNTNEDEE